MTGAPVKLYLDEHVWRELTQRLREKGYDALHVYDVDRGGLSDEANLSLQLKRAGLC
jgi:hypothetical protein